MTEVVLLVEPFYCGSHKQLCDLLLEAGRGAVSLHTMPGKKWHWRARTSALYFAQVIPKTYAFRVLFASAVLNLAELVALRPDLAKLRKCLYFHENQLVYPVRKQQERDFQYGYNQVLSCLVADTVLFNSKYNMESFLQNLCHFFKLMPDFRPTRLEESIRPKCRVLYFPLSFPDSLTLSSSSCSAVTLNANTLSVPCATDDGDPGKDADDRGVESLVSSVPQYACSFPDPTDALHIVWPHRWEHDKDPETFFNVLFQLQKENVPFRLSVLGETYQETPDIFKVAENELQEHLLHFGYLSSREEYWKVLCSADVVVSTAKHEFFGVAMLEAVYCGCFPLCPRQLVYPEIFNDDSYLYSTPQQLFKRLKKFCLRPALARDHVVKVDMRQYLWSSLKEEYLQVLFGGTHGVILKN